MNKKLYFSILSSILFPALALANNCSDLKKQEEKAIAKQQFNIAFNLLKEAEEEAYCYEDNTQQFIEEKKRIFKLWGDQLFKEIFQKRPIRLDKNQTARLLKFGDQLQEANSNIEVRNAWQIAFLHDMWQVSNDRKKTFMNTDYYKRFDEILLGYIDDLKSGELSDIVKASDVDSFVKELLESQLLVIGEEIQAQFKTRGSGTGAISQLLAVRGGSLSSSAEQPIATTVSPISFEYDSTTLTSQGENEYKENLKNMQAGTTNSIFLIGHTDTKGAADYNCWLSQCRVKALKNKLIYEDGIPEHKIEVAWAGENIPLKFDHAGELMNRDILASQQVDPHNENNPSRRRVEYELNGTTLKQKYHGKFCQLKPQYIDRPCH